MNLAALGFMVILLLLNGFFVAAEFAFTAASRPTLATQTTRSARAAVASIDELSFTLAGAQLGINICSLLLGVVAEPAIASLIESSVGSFVEIPPQVLHPIALVIALSIVVFLHMVIGEMAPKNIAITEPERASLWMAIPFRAYAMVFRPLIWLLNGMANMGLRTVGIDPNQIGEPHTSSDLSAMISAGRSEGVVEEVTHRLLTGAIDLAALEASHVMVPRPDVTAVPMTTTLTEFEKAFTRYGYSRIPVYGEGLDDIRGFIHAKDLLRLDRADMDQPIPEEMLRSALVIPESVRVDRLLESMRRSRSHFAVVIDEHGGTSGIVTMEDIVEEVVGEIRDEHDVESEGIRRLSLNRWLIDASLRPAEVRRASGVRLPDGEYDTMSGFVMEHAGRIPSVGDRISDENWTITVRSMEGRRIKEIDLIAKHPSET